VTTRRVEQVMGMPISLALRGRHAQDDGAEAAWQEVLASLREVDWIFSTYRHDSEISRLNRGEVELAACSPLVREVLALAEQARVESGGAFDVRLPGADGGRTLDPSGVVKGWAVQRASAALEDLDGTDYCLAAGGDMVCRTRVPGSSGWRIGIEDPSDPAAVLAVVPVRNGAVATSGTARRGHHLVDPRSGVVPTEFASVTVVGPDLTWVDIEATAAFVLGRDAYAWLEKRTGRTGVLVRHDGTVRTFASAS
jgi:thiamine biosynthesis lipoprotein